MRQGGVPAYEIFTMMRLPTVALYVLATYNQHFDIIARFLCFYKLILHKSGEKIIYSPFSKFQIQLSVKNPH